MPTSSRNHPYKPRFVFTAPVFIDYLQEAVTAVNTALNILFCHKLADKRAVLRRVGNTHAAYQARLAV